MSAGYPDLEPKTSLPEVCVSVVINTYNRAESLADTLAALRYQIFPSFEVVVVNGPSTDCTASVVSRYPGRIKLRNTAVSNLSASRNAGIKASAGDIIAFLDDDAVPDPNWISTGVLPFSDPAVAVVGTAVKDLDGRSYQYTPWVVDDRFTPLPWLIPPFPSFAESGRRMFPHIMGCSSFFRKDALVAVGGFDEEIEYFLDETEVQFRIHQRGLKLVPLSFGGAVLHRWRANRVRSTHTSTDRSIRNPYALFKSKTYCMLKHHGEAGDTAYEAIDLFKTTVLEEAPADEMDRQEYVRNISLGVQDGIQSFRDSHIDSNPTAPLMLEVAQFLPFRPQCHDPLHICLTSRWGEEGGVGIYFDALAKRLAEMGHAVRFLKPASDLPKVEFRDGVWYHEVPTAPQADFQLHDFGLLAEPALRHALACYLELCDIHRRSPIQIVYTPLWDLEGIYACTDTRWETIVALQTSFHHYAALNRNKLDKLEAFWLLQLERLYVNRARNFHAISTAIGDYVVNLRDKAFGPAKISTIPIGLPDLRKVAPLASTRFAELAHERYILFVGRLEERKNVRGLVQAFAARIAPQTDHTLVLCGRDCSILGGGPPYENWIQSAYPSLARGGRIRMTGEITEKEKFALLEGAEFVCMPSLYESFGLVVVEAFRQRKAVIGSSLGGGAEVIRSGVDGIIVDPRVPGELEAAMERLSLDDGMRITMGRRGRQSFESNFTDTLMARALLEMFQSVRRCR